MVERNGSAKTKKDISVRSTANEVIEAYGNPMQCDEMMSIYTNSERMVLIYIEK